MAITVKSNGGGGTKVFINDIKTKAKEVELEKGDFRLVPLTKGTNFGVALDNQLNGEFISAVGSNLYEFTLYDYKTISRTGDYVTVPNCPGQKNSILYFIYNSYMYSIDNGLFTKLCLSPVASGRVIPLNGLLYVFGTSSAYIFNELTNTFSTVIASNSLCTYFHGEYGTFNDYYIFGYDYGGGNDGIIYKFNGTSISEFARRNGLQDFTGYKEYLIASNREYSFYRYNMNSVATSISTGYQMYDSKYIATPIGLRIINGSINENEGGFNYIIDGYRFKGLTL